MRFNLLLALIIFFPLAVIQSNVIPYFSYNQIAPDLIVILLVFYTLKTGQIAGSLLGFLFGFIYDMISGGILGSAMFSYTLCGFIAGYFFNENKVEMYVHSVLFLLVILLCATVNSLVYSFFSVQSSDINLVVVLFEQGLLPGLYTAVVALPLTIFYPKKLFQ
jgi:rod shape-determining protein MreD